MHTVYVVLIQDLTPERATVNYSYHTISVEVCDFTQSLSHGYRHYSWIQY
jgi:hypothetical protein